MTAKPQTIVSLTSFPEAIPYAVTAIRTIISGTVLPDRIVLYLDTQKFPEGKLPDELKALINECPIFEVRFDPQDIRSYKKLIPALRDFPDDIIVTIDDDILYTPDLLGALLRVHKRYPHAVIAHRVRKIQPGLPYRKWRKLKWYDFIFKKYRQSFRYMQTGVGGVLYPPHSLDTDMLDPAIFTKLAPTTDDLWFWAAAVSAGTYIVPVPDGMRTAKEVGKPGDLSLKSVNLRPGDDRNRMAFDRILECYPVVAQRLKEDCV